MSNALAAAIQELAEAKAIRNEAAKPLYYAEGDNVRAVKGIILKKGDKSSKGSVRAFYRDDYFKCFWVGVDRFDTKKKRAGIKYTGGKNWATTFVEYGDVVNANATHAQVNAYMEAKAWVIGLDEAVAKMKGMVATPEEVKLVASMSPEEISRCIPDIAAFVDEIEAEREANIGPRYVVEVA